jgi:hypothetical protein
MYATGPAGMAAGRRPQTTVTRVRTNDVSSAGLLKEAVRRSATIRKLLAELETSDVLVVVATWNERGERGLTQLAVAASGVRVLIVRVTMFLIVEEQIAVLGHELQHAYEISAAPEVTSDEALRRLFDRIGDRTSWSGDRFETAAARDIERRVLEEVRLVR